MSQYSYTDGWGNTAHSGTGYSDHVRRRPVVVDAAEGRKKPTVRFASEHNTEGYVMKTERVVEHISHAAPVVSFGTDYQYSYDEPLVDWHARPNTTGKGYSQYEQSEAYPTAFKGTNPSTIDRYMFNEGPRNERLIAPSHALSKPTNNIGSAVEFLTAAVKPSYAPTTQTGGIRPMDAGPLSPIRWRTGKNMAAQGHNMDSAGEEDDWDNPKEQSIYGTNPIKNQEGNERATGNAAPNRFGYQAPSVASSQQPRFTAPTMQPKQNYPSSEVIDSSDPNRFGYQAPSIASSQQPRFAAPTMQPKQNDPSSEVIDSSEARKRYGKLKNQPEPEEKYKETIDSNVARKKYGGVRVPW